MFTQIMKDYIENLDKWTRLVDSTSISYNHRLV